MKYANTRIKNKFKKELTNCIKYYIIYINKREVLEKC